MNLISWAVFGLIAGIIAKMISPGPEPGGVIVTIVIGVLGAIVGGWLSTLIFDYDPNKWSLGGFFVAVVGALLLLFVYKKLAR
uniref:GlsB/YeaQ/YmgE family stress response membrane protein n=1 Tax=Vaginella massiliensis TaxID=1816680 RepID=UPI000B9A1A2D|nr:GlsB/YeaQ/YmgE family stress response membrane protein [Vaginella massiliensis]